MSDWQERRVACVEQPPGRAQSTHAIAVGVSRRVDVIATSDPDDLRRLLGPGFTSLTV